MEKLRVSWTKASIIAGLIYLLIDFLFNFGEFSLLALMKYMISLIILFVVFDIFEYFDKKGLYFSIEGISLSYRKKTYFKKWDDVKLEKKIDFRYFKIFEFDIGAPKKCIIVICWPSIKSLLYLNNKYVPKNHELYRMIDAYSKNN